MTVVIYNKHMCTRDIQKVLQVDMLNWKTFQYLYTNKTHISP